LIRIPKLALEISRHIAASVTFFAQTRRYPLGQKWTAEDNKLYKLITKDIVDGVTHELTLQDVENDPNWITKSTCIVGVVQAWVGHWITSLTLP
jgi:hypothetical protein